MSLPLKTINDAKRFLISEFRAAGIDSADIDARMIVMASTELSHADVIARGAETLPPNIITDIKALAKRRIEGEPIDHIMGYREFYGRNFKVTKDVLSPRPETEMLVDEALAFIKDKPKTRILDLGTGSGAIIISLLAEDLSAIGTATDMSEAALKVARDNANTHTVAGRIVFIQGRWFEPLRQQFDLIVSNPPYINDRDMEALPPEVKTFDPDLALRGGGDGLDAYRSIISRAKEYLALPGKIIFEIGYDQGGAVSKLLSEFGFVNVEIHQDLAGHDRVVTATNSR